MDQTVVNILLDQHKELRQDVKDLDSKIDQVLEWKWKIIGGSFAISSIITFLFQIGVIAFKKG